MIAGPFGLEHIGIHVRDLFAMERFYRTVLGFQPVYRYVSANTPGLRTVFLQRDGMRLELLESPDSDPRPGTFHLAFVVGDVDEVFRQIMARFPELPGRTPRTTGDGYREAEVRDPEGNTVELSVAVAPSPRYPLRAVIFDLDGTLIDSEPNYLLADQELLGRYGIPFTAEEKQRYIGGSNLDMMNDLVKRHGLPIAPEALGEEKNQIYLRIAEANTRVFEPMRRFLDGLCERGVPVAVASGSAPAVITRLLEVTGLSGTFAHVVSAEEVAHGKPAPDVFLEAARRLGIPPHHCAVVEDSRPGVEAALRGFMRCIAVPYLTHAPLDPTFAMADLLFPDGMDHFQPETALAWVAQHQPQD